MNAREGGGGGDRPATDRKSEDDEGQRESLVIIKKDKYKTRKKKKKRQTSISMRPEKTQLGMIVESAAKLGQTVPTVTLATLLFEISTIFPLFPPLRPSDS